MQRSKASFLIAIFVLQILSLTTIWSTTPSLFLTQLSFVIIGALIVLFVSRIDLTVIFSLWKVWYYLSLALLVITFFVGRDIRGSVRWIDFGFFNLQTSEVVKPLLAIYFSVYLAKNQLKTVKDFFVFLLYAAVPAFLVLRQPDLGSALTILFLPFFLLIVSGYFKQVLIITALSLAVLIPLESMFLKPYQRQRIETFFNPYKDPQGAGYNVIQATVAVGSGGLLGKGVKLGTQSHLNFLPERHTDFIFASFTEEFGFLGAGVLLFCFYLIFRYCLYIARRQKDSAGYLISLAALSVFLFQFLVNVGMNLGIMPVTGITLPFFSYGGSSLLSFAIFIGILVRQLDLLPPVEV